MADPCRRPCAAGREVRSAVLELLMCLAVLAVLADGLPVVRAACPQAVLEGVRDQPA
jgi:hypothetical protein